MNETLWTLVRAGLAAIALSLTVSGTVAAWSPDGETGVVEGRVTDDEGRGLDGVRVAVRCGEAGIDLELDTSKDGRYGVVGLPRGSYSVEVWAEGHSSAIAEEVGLDPGETLRLDFTLAPGKGIAITVISSPRIDVASAARVERVSPELVEQLPGRQSLAAIGRLTTALTELPVPAAGIEPVREGLRAAEVRGRSLGEVTVTVDGVSSGRSTPPLELDMASRLGRTLEVTAGSLSPARGGSPGGAVRLAAPATPGIGEPWHVGLDLGVGADGLGGRGSEGRSLGGPDVERRVRRGRDLTARVGGTTPRGGFGLFAAAAERRGEVEQVLGGGEEQRQELDEASQHLRLFAAPAESVRLTATAARSRIESDGLLADASSLSEEGAAAGGSGDRESRRATLSLDLAVTRRLDLQVWAGWLDGERRDPAEPGDRLVFLTSSLGLGAVPGSPLPPSLSRPAGFSTGKPGLAESGARDGIGLVGQATWRLGGRHLFSVGAEHDELDLELRRELLGTRSDVRWRSDGSEALGTRYDLAAALVGAVDRERRALSMEDRWRLGERWTLQLGLRAEAERWSAGPGVGDIDLGLELEPRLGLAWDVAGDGNTVVYLSADRQGPALDERLAVAALGSVSIARTIGAFTDVFELTSPIAARPVETLSGPVLVDPDLEPETWRQLALGTEQLVIPGLRVRAEASYRELERIPALVFVERSGLGAASQGAQAVLTNPGHGLARRPYGADAPEHPGAISRWLGVEMAADMRLGGRYTAGGAYTYSEAEGNADGGVTPFEDSGSLAAFGAGQGAGNLLPSPVCARLEGCFATDGSLSTERLLTDRRHRWKVYGSVVLPGGVDLAAHFLYLSGDSTPARIPVVSESDGTLAAVGAVPVPDAERPGLGDAITQLDLQASWSLRAGPFTRDGRRLTLVLAVTNALDRQRALTRWDRLTLEPIVVPRAALFEGFDALALAESQGVAPDPRFGRPRVVQRPREARVDLRFAF